MDMIEVRNVCKDYRVYHDKSCTLKLSLIHI